MESRDMTETEISGKALELKEKYPELDINICGKWVWISGNTFPYRKSLKTIGCNFSKTKEKWYFAGCPSSGKSVPFFKIAMRYGLKSVDNGAIVEKEKPDFFASVFA